jgi:alpha-ketoglutarate-dependent 2,4-dichlorophenoxyacetate dioxygenase
MAITVHPVSSTFVAEVCDVDLSQPLTPEDASAIKEAFWKYAVLIFPAQELTQQQHVNFGQVFGRVEADRIVDNKDQKSRFGNEFSDVSNLDAEGRIWAADSRQREYKAANRQWHTDSSFRFTPGKCSLLYARSIPPVGGQTEFTDERAAYDALDEKTKTRLQGLVGEHCLATSRKRGGFTRFTEHEYQRAARIPQLLVRTVPESGRKTLYLAAHVGRIYDLAEAESDQLLEELTEHATQRQFVYSHRWREKDLVMWDNRCTMHRGMDYDDLRWARDMRRVTIADVGNTCELANVPLPEEYRSRMAAARH